jgi:sialate O-acetylesterase
MPKDVVPLSSQWKMQVGVEMPNCPGGDVSMQNQPTTLYNAVVYPLAPYAINGVVWYQGESNTGNPAPYADYLRKLMGCWRDRWQQPLPFCIVQLANYDGRQQTGNPQPIVAQTAPVNSNWARLREAQRLAVKGDGLAELAVINDLGETVDIHPLRKKEVAERVSICLDRLIYNNKVKLSPEVISAEVQGDKVLLTLDQPVVAGELNDFELAGSDGRFVNAKAEVTAGKPTVIVLHGGVSAPKKVRYAWKDNPLRANVRSLTGLPMSSFEMVF